MTKRLASLALGVVAFTLPLGAGSGALMPGKVRDFENAVFQAIVD